MKNRGQTGILIALGLGVALMGVSISLTKISENKNKEMGQFRTEALKGFYALETMAWHTYARKGMSGMGGAGSKSGRTIATMSATYNTTPTGIAADAYNAASYVDGTALNVVTTSKKDAGSTLFNPRAMDGLEVWNQSSGGKAQYCSSLQSEGSGRVKMCLSELYIPPAIGTFTSSASTVTAGSNVTLSWTSSNAVTCIIDQGVGNVGGNSSRVVTVAATATYTLTCSNPAGTDSKSVTVTAINPPPVVNLTSSATSVAANATITLSWTTQYASTCNLTNVGSVGGNSSRTQVVTVTTTYTLSCSNAAGTTSDSVTVTVIPPPNVVIKANGNTSSPQFVTYQSTANVSWSATGNIDSCNLRQTPPGTNSTVSTNGNRDFQIDNDYTFDFTCSGPGGTSTASMRVSPPEQLRMTYYWNHYCGTVDCNGFNTIPKYTTFVPYIYYYDSAFSGTTSTDPPGSNLLPITMDGGYATRRDWLARIQGMIRIPTTGTYTFHIYSDDGTKLWIDNNLVVNNDGDHSSTWRSSASITLTAGMHDLDFKFYNHKSGWSMWLAWQASMSIIPASYFYHKVP